MIQEAFRKFYKKIKLTKKQRADAKTKHEGVCKKLHDHYYFGIEYDGSTKLLIGSYGKHTNIRPPRDVDVIFILPQNMFARYEDNKSNPQSQLLHDVKEILSEKYTTTEKIKVWGKVVLVEFADGTHNIEILPAWEDEDGTFKIPNSEKGGSWENWDVRSELENINEFENDNGITRQLIRTIKKWSDNCSVNLKTYQIETTILDFLFQGGHVNKSFPVIVRDFFNFFKEITKQEEIKSHLSTAYNRSYKACEYEDSQEFTKASEEWRKVFGIDFPYLEDTKNMDKLSVKIANYQKSYPSLREEFLEKNYGIKFNLKPEYIVGIDAVVEQDGFRPTWLSMLSFLQKRKKLTFQITNNTVQSPYLVKWKVRNFGEEANLANDLRGEISDDQGKERKIENTKYLGEHYIECYIIKNNQCVAIGRMLVPIRNSF